MNQLKKSDNEHLSTAPTESAFLFFNDSSVLTPEMINAHIQQLENTLGVQIEQVAPGVYRYSFQT